MFPKSPVPKFRYDLDRCAYLAPSGRRCRSNRCPQDATLCARHAAFSKRKNDAILHDATDLSTLLSQDASGQKSASDIHAHLWNLSLALQQGRISPRRAAVLAYIHSLLLRTLPAIDKNNLPGAPGRHTIQYDLTGMPRPASPPAPSLDGAGDHDTLTLDVFALDTTSTRDALPLDTSADHVAAPRIPS